MARSYKVIGMVKAGAHGDKHFAKVLGECIYTSLQDDDAQEEMIPAGTNDAPAWSTLPCMAIDIDPTTVDFLKPVKFVNHEAESPLKVILKFIDDYSKDLDLQVTELQTFMEAKVKMFGAMQKVAYEVMDV